MKTEAEIYKKMDEIVARVKEIRREHPYEDIREAQIVQMMHGANSALEWVLKPSSQYDDDIQILEHAPK